MSAGRAAAAGATREAIPLSVTVHPGGRRQVDADALRACLADHLQRRCPPGLSLAVVSSDGVFVEAHGGYACTVGTLVPVTSSTLYDLASLTKVVCSTTLALVARQTGRLRFEDPVASWLPAFPRPDITVQHLLTHTSGIVEHVAFFETLRGRGSIEPAVYEWASTATRDGAVRYSDLNFMLVGWLLEACYGLPLDVAFRRLAAQHGLEGARFCPPPSSQHITAATELDGDQRPGPGLVLGEVHDGNAWALGGVAGHAGLFAPLDSLSRFVQLLLTHAPAAERAGAPGDAHPTKPAEEPPRLLDAGSRRLMRTRLAATGTDVRGVGWRLHPTTWGDWSPDTLWHTGFTGTSLLVAPDQDLGVVLLTNCIHPHRQLEVQAQMREAVHRLIAEQLL